MQNMIRWSSKKLLSAGWRLQAVANHLDAKSLAKKNRSNKDSIFVWIPKTAGTSLYDSLRRFGAQKLNREYDLQAYFRNTGIVTFCHCDIKTLINDGVISPNYFQSAWKFAFVRNPFDRAVSLYEYLRGLEIIHPRSSFETFCEILLKKEFEPIGRYNFQGLSQLNQQSDWIFDQSGNLLVDYVGKFEKLSEGLRVIESNLGLGEGDLEISHKNPSNRDRSFRAYYTAKEVDIVRHVYESDFKLLEYDASSFSTNTL